MPASYFSIDSSRPSFPLSRDLTTSSTTFRWSSNFSLRGGLSVTAGDSSRRRQMLHALSRGLGDPRKVREEGVPQKLETLPQVKGRLPGPDVQPLLQLVEPLGELRGEVLDPAERATVAEAVELRAGELRPGA